MSHINSFVTTVDGVDIFYKDWGSKSAKPIMFHHGWPLSSDDWDAQLMYFVEKGYRVIAHDRRGHGRSSQVDYGNDMDHYASDAAAVAEFLDLRNAVHVGHSTGGGEVARYVAKHGQPQGRVAAAVLISSVPPLLVRTKESPEGVPIKVFDGYRESIIANRSQFYKDIAFTTFYNNDKPGSKISHATMEDWWRKAMMGGAKPQYDCVAALSETNQTEDLEAITVPTLILQGDADQHVPYKASGQRQAELIKGSTLKIYRGFPHGMHTSEAETVNKAIYDFIK